MDSGQGSRGTSLGGRDQSLRESRLPHRSFLCQWGAMEAAKEVHPAGLAGPGHGEARRRGADPGGGPVSGGGVPGNRRSEGAVSARALAEWERRGSLGLCGWAGVSAYLHSVSILLPQEGVTASLCPWCCHLPLWGPPSLFFPLFFLFATVSFCPSFFIFL